MRVSDLAANRLVLDPNAAGDLRALMRSNPAAGAKQVASQFEGMLLGMMLKSMREASASSGLLDSEQSRFFTAAGDQQLALKLAAQAPLGFAALVERQLARQGAAGAAALDENAMRAHGLAAGGWLASARTAGRPAAGEAGTGAATSPLAGKARDFVDRVWPHALDAAAATGIPARFLVAQSALESGWGKREIRAADGAPSYNLFGIKAGRNWRGKTVEVRTTEYVDGVAQTVRAKFRAYDSYADAFRDYADLLRSKPRFADVVGQQDGVQFARSLQRAGYATDPLYADKLARIINGSTLRQALAA